MVAAVNTRPLPAHGWAFDHRARRDARHSSILSEAARLFNSKGSRATTLREIAASLGLTKSSLYYYVRTKEELVYQCYLNTLAQYHDVLDRIEGEHAGAPEQLAAFFKQYFDRWLAAQEGRGPHAAALLELGSLNAVHRTEVEKQYVIFFRRLRQVVRDGIADQSLQPCESTSATRALLGALPAWSPSWLHTLPLEQVEAIAEDAWNVFVGGLAAPGSHDRLTQSVRAAPIQVAADAFMSRDESNRRKQTAFFQAGIALFNEKGYKGSSLAEISKVLEVSKGAFYYHIRNKQDLLVNCYDYSLDIVEAIQERAAQSELCGMEKLDQMCADIFCLENSDLGPLIRYTTLPALTDQHRSRVLARINRCRKRFSQLIREGIEDGSIRAVNSRVAGSMLASAMNASMNMKRWRRIDDVEQAAADYLSVFRQGLLARPA